MKTKLFMNMAIAATMLAGCNNDNESTDNGPVELKLTSGVELQQTRAFTPTQSTVISKDEVVNVWVDDAGKTPGPVYKAYQLTANGTGGFTGTSMWFPQTGNNIDIYGIHGKFATLFVLGNDFPAAAVEYQVNADQSTATAYANSDLLYAYEKNVGRTGNPTTKELTFYHMLSKLELAIKLGNGAPVLATTGAVKLGAVTLNGNFLPSKTAAMGTQTERAAMLSVATTASSGDMTLGQVTCNDFGTNLHYNEAILVPQNMRDKVLTFTLKDGAKLSYKIPVFTGESTALFASGKKYSYQITVNLTGLTVTSKITDWDPVGPITGNAEMEYPID